MQNDMSLQIMCLMRFIRLFSLAPVSGVTGLLQPIVTVGVGAVAGKDFQSSLIMQ